MSRGEGDCSEYSVLLAALCRAVGIPARIVFGLVYIGAPEAGGPAFGYHFWTQAWIGNRWVGLDATAGWGKTTAGHIRLADTAMANTKDLMAILPAMACSPYETWAA